MKPLVFLVSAGLKPFADEKIFQGLSAREKARIWADSVPDSAGTDFIDTAKTLPSVFLHMADAAQSLHADCAVLAYADCPFLNNRLCAELLELHRKYAAEYTFADGYPYGFTPEIIDVGLLRILAALAEAKSEFAQAVFNRDSVFSLLKTDINSFEIETLIAPQDYRYLRLDFSCSSKRNTLACRRLFNLLPECDDADLLCKTAAETADVQRTLPSFYNVQIYASGEKESIYEPAVKGDCGPVQADIDSFKTLTEKIAAFSGDAVVGLSFCGDPLYHADFASFAEAVLEHKELSLLIETDAQMLDEQTALRIQRAAGANEVRLSGYAAVNWIIKLDACDEQLYKEIRTRGSLKKGEEAVHLLKKLFPGAVYPQMVRMNCSEHQLEGFFRHWKADGGGELIIQKYDHISGLLEDMRPADLSPAVRTPCWHIKRDMCILADGRVPRCKAAVFDSGGFYGNVFTEGLEKIWDKGYAKLNEQLGGTYDGQCGKSDEYYTFNF